MEGKEIVFVLGGPGSGKGTQALTISKEHGIGYLSTGDLLRAATAPLPEGVEDQRSEKEKQTIEELKKTMQNGQLVPDEIVIDLVEKELKGQNAKYFFLDGFPRSLSQAQKFTEQIGPCKGVLFLDVPDEELTKRLLNRGLTSGRSDDNEESIKKRLVTYHQISVPVIEYYEPKGKVIRIDGSKGISDVHDEIISVLRSKLNWQI
ncbi:Adenylate kinase family protein [Histomonas meleagridis]|uniref:Adenylate kinase family protein n=1 Tax=Histomonas meleagridis TaxID=135588 RepID=UPI00355A4D5E|nr:Adenylate kinase family protein [Histomonas meleagridis]KAH0805003.1 Adenylate kinase family protein [Histomonas meleagridis]